MLIQSQSHRSHATIVWLLLVFSSLSCQRNFSAPLGPGNIYIYIYIYIKKITFWDFTKRRPKGGSQKLKMLIHVNWLHPKQTPRKWKLETQNLRSRPWWFDFAAYPIRFGPRWPKEKAASLSARPRPQGAPARCPPSPQCVSGGRHSKKRGGGGLKFGCALGFAKPLQTKYPPNKAQPFEASGCFNTCCNHPPVLGARERELPSHDISHFASLDSNYQSKQSASKN